MINSYKSTKIAAYIGYITQALVNNLAPLLFVTFSKDFNLSLTKLSILITVNFGTQILIDLFSSKYINRIGYRKSCVIAHLFAAAGLLSYGILPFVLPAFLGLLISAILCAVGGGLDEVIISPVMEAIPGDAKSSDMSLLHSFYSWGQVLVVVGSTLFFCLAGIENWRFVAYIWAIIPLADAFLFMFVPINELPETENAKEKRRMFTTKTFWLLFVMMTCAGASELAMSQWASLFAEEGLGVSKTMGDLLGPCMFAVFMGISRVIYGVCHKLNLERFMILSGILCIVSYLTVTFVPNPVIALLGCGLCGFSVGIMWPGTYSIASKKMPLGGTKMFALLAFAGDIGCTGGPDLVGLIGNAFSSIRVGLGFGVIFPIVLTICGVLCYKKMN